MRQHGSHCLRTLRIVLSFLLLTGLGTIAPVGLDTSMTLKSINVFLFSSIPTLLLAVPMRTTMGTIACVSLVLWWIRTRTVFSKTALLIQPLCWTNASASQVFTKLRGNVCRQEDAEKEVTSAMGCVFVFQDTLKIPWPSFASKKLFAIKLKFWTSKPMSANVYPDCIAIHSTRNAWSALTDKFGMQLNAFISAELTKSITSQQASANVKQV